MEYPRDKKGRKTTCTCPRTVEHIYTGTHGPSNSTQTVVKRNSNSSDAVSGWQYCSDLFVRLVREKDVVFAPQGRTVCETRE